MKHPTGFFIKRPANDGFSIIELIIYMGIISVLLVILTQIFTSSIDTQLESSADSTADQNINFILTRLQYDLHRADSIVSPANPGDSGSLLELDIGGTSYTYQLTDTQLQLTSPAPAQLISDSATTVTDFVVTRIGNGDAEDTVQINLGLSSQTVTSRGTTQSRQLQTTVSIR